MCVVFKFACVPVLVVYVFCVRVLCCSCVALFVVCLVCVVFSLFLCSLLCVFVFIRFCVFCGMLLCVREVLLFLKSCLLFFWGPALCYDGVFYLRVSLLML